jgi:Sulfotransferase family
MGAEKPIADTAQRWRNRIEEARRQARRLRGRYLELRYEDLVAAPEPPVRRVCQLIELDYDRAMLDYHERAGERLAELGDLPATGARGERPGEERRASHALAARPPTAARMGAWREQMSAAERAEFEAVAGDLLVELGYELPS